MKSNPVISYCFNSILLGSAMMWVVFSIQAAPGPEDVIVLSISCAKQDWLVAEPVVLQLVYRNIGRSNVSISPELQNGTGTASYMISNDGEHFKSVGSTFYHDPVGRKISIAPDESYFHEEVLFYDSNTDGLLFPGSGDYFLRVDDYVRRSNVVRIRVKEPESPADKKWSEEIKTRTGLRAFARLGLDTDGAITKLRACAEENSTFTSYASLFLASVERNRTNALVLLEHSDVAGFPLRSAAVLEMGKIYMELEKKQLAQQEFLRIINEFPNSAAASEVKSRQLVQASIVKPSSSDVLTETIKSLESEWYDVEGFGRDLSAPGAREYQHKRLDLYQAMFDGKLTEGERAQQEAELVKTYVKKYCKPLPPDEWKRLNDGYAKEEADRREQQVLELKRHAAESELLFQAARSNAVPK